jgi:hypothetical protein
LRTRALRPVLAALLVTGTSVLVTASPAHALHFAMSGEPFLNQSVVHGNVDKPNGGTVIQAVAVSADPSHDAWSTGDHGPNGRLVPGASFTLRVDWTFEDPSGDAPDTGCTATGGNPTAFKVEIRTMHGSQIGTSDWDGTITGHNKTNCDAGVTSTTFYLDNNPLDTDTSALDGNLAAGTYELFVSVSGDSVAGGAAANLSDGDSRGDLVNGPAVSTYNARGFLIVDPSLVFSEEWQGVNGANWNSTRWTTSYGSGGVASDVEIFGNEGRLYVSSADAKATAQTSNLANPELLLTYRFEAPNPSDARGYRSGFRVVLKSDGGSSLTSGYRVEVQSDSSTIKLRRFSGGSVTNTTSFTYTKDTLAHRMRFYVDGGFVGVKVWPASVQEPQELSISYTDPSPLPSGKLQLQHNHTGGTRSVMVDNLYLFDQNLGGTQQTISTSIVCFPYFETDAPMPGTTHEVAAGERCYDENQTTPPSCYDHHKHNGKYATTTIGYGAGRLKFSFQETPYAAVAIHQNSVAWYTDDWYHETQYRFGSSGVWHEAGYLYKGSHVVFPEDDDTGLWNVWVVADHGTSTGKTRANIPCEF